MCHPAPMAIVPESRARRIALAVAFQGLLAIITTWPLATRWRTHLPLGAESVPTVPQFNLWTLQWNAARIPDLFRGYWDAPIFAPTAGAFARSEAQPLTGLLFTVVRPFTGEVGGYNLVLLTMLTLNGLVLALLARRLGADYPAALLAGALGQTLPFVSNELGVLQLVPLFPFWLLLERLVAYRQRPNWVRLADAGAALGALALVSGYYALFTGLVLVVIGPPLVIGARPWRQLARDVAIAGAIAGAIALPFSLAQQRHTAGSSWSYETVEANSARGTDLVRHDDGTVGVPWAFERDGGQALFPGGVALLLAGIGIAGATRTQRRFVVGAIVAAALLAIVALGLRLHVAGHVPYAFVRDHVPGFDRLRSPFRAAVMTQALLAALGALGLAWLWRRPAGRVLAVAFVVASVIETVHWDQPTSRVPDVAGFDWVQWLDDAPSGVVAMVPFPATGNVGDYDDTTVAMLAGLEHGHPLVNGYTGLFPESYRSLRSEMAWFPDAATVAMLDEFDVTYVVIRHDWERATTAAVTLPALGYERVFAGATRDVWRRR